MNIKEMNVDESESKRIERMAKFRHDIEASGVLKDLNGSFINDIQDNDNTGGMTAVVAHNSHKVEQLGSIPSPATYKEHIVEPFHPDLINERQDTQLRVSTDCTGATQG